MLTIHTCEHDTITLEAKEFFFLAGILGSDRLLGIEDPFRGYLAEEIAEEWEAVKAALCNKGYLVQDENEMELSMLPVVFSRVAIAGLSERSCWLKYSHHGETFEGYLHVTNERVVQVCKCEPNSSCYRLDELGTVDDVCNQLVDELGFKEGFPTEVPALFFSQHKFNELYENALSVDLETLCDQLAEATDDVEGSIALAKCLQFRSLEGEMNLSVWDGQKWETQSAAFLANDSMNWLIRKSMEQDQDWIIASPMSKKQFQDMLLGWLKQSA
ncbi:hypothetical protein J2T13_005020 [Paenibacillus sp. DS2015]|uniref:hypothetical protein n=1 Tax=Paenibacillus sp. DS2015 TaxID=3373917 RepID=UPI003D1AD07C